MNAYLSDPKTGEGFQAITAELTDAIERQTYATYGWLSDEKKKYWEVAPMTCELRPSLSDKRYCKDRDEFDAFVAPYMRE
jgi:hypothetical protein